MKLSFNMKGMVSKNVNVIDRNRPMVNKGSLEGMTLEVELTPEEFGQVLANSLDSIREFKGMMPDIVSGIRGVAEIFSDLEDRRVQRKLLEDGKA